MGMLMNRFNMLTQLREDIKQNKDMGFNHQSFVLSGVVVHDTNDHELIECMGKNFVKWAEMTGHHFLFITFIPPSIEWKNSTYCHDGFWIDKDNLLVDSSFSKEDEERTMPLLRDFMGLPQLGSFLMLTENLCSNTFYKIPICSGTIEEQFALITRYCEDEFNGVDHTPADFKKLLSVLNAGEFSIMNSLLDVLIDFTAIKSNLVENGEEKKREQLKQADNVIDKVRAMLRLYQGDDFEDRLFHLFECTEIVFTRLFNKNQAYLEPDYRGAQAIHFESEQYMDEYSTKLLETYSLLSSIISKREGEDLDYSGLTIYLVKIVENELHLSVGQMLRWAMGIDMPAYYNKYCRRKHRVMVPSGRQKVDLNQSLSSSDYEAGQKGIPMGTLLAVYENMYYCPENIYPQPDSSKMQELDSELLRFLKNFSSSYRNPAGHLDSNSKKTYEGAKVAFKEFLDSYLIKLYNIKQTIKDN